MMKTDGDERRSEAMIVWEWQSLLAGGPEVQRTKLMSRENDRTCRTSGCEMVQVGGEESRWESEPGTLARNAVAGVKSQRREVGRVKECFPCRRDDVSTDNDEIDPRRKRGRFPGIGFEGDGTGP